MTKDQNDTLAYLRMLTMAQVSEITTYTPQHIYRLIRQGKLPQRKRLGLHRVGWRLTDIEQWLADRPAAERPDPQLN